MAHVDQAVHYLNDLSRGVKLKSYKIDEVLSSLQTYAVRKGLSHDILADLVPIWLKLKIHVSKWNTLGYCLIPEHKVADNIVLIVIHWILSNYSQEENAFKVVAALNWLLALHEFNLINPDVLDVYYEFFFFLLNLNHDKISPHACKYIYNFTKSYDVTRSKVIHILNLMKTQRQSKLNNPLLCVLGLFKSYKPECVPESIPMISVTTAFPKFNKALVERFTQAQIRCNVDVSLSKQNRLKWWSGNDYSTINKKNSLHFIPDMEYLQLGASIYSNNGAKKKCPDFLSIHDVMVQTLAKNIELPANILSLLVNDGGLHILIFSDESTQSRFSQALYHILYKNFLKGKGHLSYEEKKHFLRRVASLQTRLLQGIPVVSRFLAQYISNWNGHDFFDEILLLLEWVSFELFEELYDCILEHIGGLFLTNNVSYCCALLEVLKQLYVNIYETTFSERKPLFLSRPIKNDDLEVLNNLSNFIDDLCETSLNTLSDNMMLRHTFLETYAAITEIQLKSSQPLWTVVPKSLAYEVLCSPSAFEINSILGLFLNYRVIYDRIKESHGKDGIMRQIELTRKYSIDFANCLWFGVAISSRKQGSMLSALPLRIVEYLESNVSEADDLFDLGNHIAFAAYTRIHMPADVADKVEKEYWLESSIAPTFKNVPIFIKTAIDQDVTLD